MSERKVFPIRSDTACLLKWSWSTVFFNSGTSASCHRTKKYSIDPKNFDQFHNLPGKIEAREMMIKGEWPGRGCEYCKNTENAGGTSERLINLSEANQHWLTPPELENGTTVSVTPTILEAYFKNTCNMACVYCGAHYSSLWEAENNKFNESLPISKDIFDIRASQDNIHYDQMVSDFWKYLATNNRYQTLRRYHILGGEPFLLRELDDSIEFWHNHPNPDLVFGVISNLNIPHKRFKSYINKLEKLILNNKIWKLQLTASVDGWGDVQEYVRYGLDLQLWEQNFQYLLNKPWIDLSINSVISSLTIKSLPLLLEKINHWNTKQTRSIGSRLATPILHDFNVSRSEDNIYNFGWDLFEKDFELVLSLMPQQTATQRDHRNIIAGVASRLQQSKPNLDNINHLKKYLDRLDQRRNTNWRNYFHWLDQEFNNSYAT